MIGNLFNWLTVNRSLLLPDLGSTCSWEWCSNVCDAGYRLLVGDSEGGGLAYVDDDWHGSACDRTGFRVLAVL